METQAEINKAIISVLNEIHDCIIHSPDISYMHKLELNKALSELDKLLK